MKAAPPDPVEAAFTATAWRTYEAEGKAAREQYVRHPNAYSELCGAVQLELDRAMRVRVAHHRIADRYSVPATEVRELARELAPPPADVCKMGDCPLPAKYRKTFCYYHAGRIRRAQEKHGPARAGVMWNAAVA